MRPPVEFASNRKLSQTPTLSIHGKCFLGFQTRLPIEIRRCPPAMSKFCPELGKQKISPRTECTRGLGEPSRLRRVAYARNRRVGLRTLHRSSPTRKAREGKVKFSVWIDIACHNQTWRSWVWEMEDNAWSDVWQVWTNMNYKIVQNLMTGTKTCCSSSSSCRWLFTCFAISVSAFSLIYFLKWTSSWLWWGNYYLRREDKQSQGIQMYQEVNRAGFYGMACYGQTSSSEAVAL